MKGALLSKLGPVTVSREGEICRTGFLFLIEGDLVKKILVALSREASREHY
jgi:hypothetical protein